jgi:hypothetical protein
MALIAAMEIFNPFFWYLVLNILFVVFLSGSLLALAVSRSSEKMFDKMNAEGASRPCGSGKKLMSEQSRENPFASSHPKPDDTLTGTRSEQPHDNPYAAPAVAESLVNPTIGEISQATQIRHEHINHEASIRGIGILFYVSSFLVILIAIPPMLFNFPVFSLVLYLASGFFFAEIRGSQPDFWLLTLVNFGIGSLFVLFAVVQGWAARGLRALNGSVRSCAGAISALGLINFPVGTVISFYFICVLGSEQGQFVMTPEYAAVRAATPHVHSTTPIWLWTWVALGILVTPFWFCLAACAAYFG